MRRYTAAADAHRVGGAWWVWKRACGEPVNITRSGVAPVTGNLNQYACPSGAPLGMPPPFTVPLSAAYPRAAPGGYRVTGCASGTYTLNTVTG